MPKKDWLRCALVSAIFATLVPLISSVVIIPEEGSEIPDLASIDSNRLQGSSSDEIQEYMNDIPVRKLEGIERYTYQFKHPQFLYFYTRGMAVAFVWLLLATATVTYLGGRGRNEV